MKIDNLDTMPHIPKGVLKCLTHNPNARATQNCSIVEDLVQTLCAMSALEVLYMCPTKRNALISALGYLDLSGPSVIKFDTVDVRPLLPYHVAFQIHVEFLRMIVKCNVVDEGSSTLVMSLYCWKSFISPQLSLSMTMFSAFDERSFQPHGIITSL